MEDRARWTLTAVEFAENRLLLENEACPPSNTNAAFARVPETDMAVPDTVAVEPASWTERPLPLCPMVSTVLFVRCRLPPDRTRVADEGSLSAWELLLVLMVAPVSATTPPFSARAALANRPDVPSVTFAPSIRLPDPVAMRAWLPVTGVVVRSCTPVVVTCVPPPITTCPPSAAWTPKEPREAVETVPPVSVTVLPDPVAVTAWFAMPLTPPLVEMAEFVKLAMPPLRASTARLSLTVVAPVPSVIVRPVALMLLPRPSEITPRWPVPAWVVMMVLVLNSMAAPDNACAPTKVLGTTPGPSCTVMPWAVMLAPAFRASSPGTAACDTVMLEPAVTVQEVPSTKTGPAASLRGGAVGVEEQRHPRK
ncbi:hypothetical protein E0H43_06915 [Rhizobium leguminosarum bv. viciae]|nr:hypothetical protein E0H43_06915 [Rhizobium leguminosarum bv. viciae]